MPETPGPLHPLVQRALRSPAFARGVEESLARLRDATLGRVSATGLTAEAKGLLLAAIVESSPRLIIAVTPEDREGGRLVRAVRAFSSNPDAILFFPAPSLSPYQGVSTSLRVKREELTDLHRISAGKATLVVSSVRALSRPLPHANDFLRRSLRLAAGDEIAPDALTARLHSLGYVRVDLVVEPGDFARRGGLVDFFPPNELRPVRVDFFGDFVDQLRSFDVDTQRSEDKIESLAAAPFSIFDLGRSRAALAAELDATYRSEEWSPAAADRDSKIAALRDGRGFPGEEHWFPAGLDPSAVTDLANFAGADTIFDEPDSCVESAVRFGELLAEERTSLIKNRKIAPPPERLCLPAPEIRRRIQESPVHLSLLAVEERGANLIRIPCSATPQLRERIPEWGRLAAEEVAAGHLVVATAAERGTLERFRRLLAENDVAAGESLVESERCAVLVLSDLEAGFVLPEAELQISAGPDAFAPVFTTPPAKKRAVRAFLSDLRDLKPGDVVVHTEHGLGRFIGIQAVSFEGTIRESLEIAYEGGGKLLLPPERLDQLQKYSAFGAEPTRLDRLGGITWARSKKAAKKAARAIADELLVLYAQRATAAGFAFSKDSPWQREFEDAFEFIPTADQETAIRDVKRDMESESPMDRILVGDVGYGKTEVAMRAAFKSVLDGKQVALLAPTTLLAYQHFRTFRRRFASFPVSIELLSRFRSAAAQKALVKKAGEGGVDIVIGTHRLLAKDVVWKDLGLLVIDEEQRFGVAQKEKMKKMAVGVDILALSATPIPRTLSMALSGLREMSVIETPPKDRLAVETRVAPFEAQLIKESVAAEIERGGQVFFVHNRVGSMEGMRQYLERLLPGVRIVAAHGQMSEGDLERAISAFIDRQFDVLLASAIIENGIDIPNCNTMLVSRADRFGLAQLYQLRGRVGRSDRLAHCYLLVPPDRSMTDTARKRLAALQEFCDLGAGFRIAARDLEIRGAGEILGAEQHGQIAAVGFETYCRLLEEAVAEAKGTEAPPPSRTVINLGFSTAIPRSYLGEDGLRLSIYKRIAEAESREEVDELEQELADRFGERPDEVESLLDTARLRIFASRAGISTVEKSAGRLLFHFHPTRSAVDAAGAPAKTASLERIVELVRTTPGAALSPDGSLSIPAREAGSVLLVRALETVRALAGESITSSESRSGGRAGA